MAGGWASAGVSGKVGVVYVWGEGIGFGLERKDVDVRRVGAGGGGRWWTEKATAIQRKRESATRFDFHTHPTLVGPFPAEAAAMRARADSNAAQLELASATRRHQLIRSDGVSSIFHA
jgi:hypothetical protein